MGRKKRWKKIAKGPYMVPLLILIGLIMGSWAIYQSSWGSASMDWTSMGQTVAGAIGYLFILGMAIYTLNHAKLKNPFAILMIFFFLGIVSASFFGYLYVEEVIVHHWDYDLMELQIAIMLLFVLMSFIPIARLKGR